MSGVRRAGDLHLRSLAQLGTCRVHTFSSGVDWRVDQWRGDARTAALLYARTQCRGPWVENLQLSAPIRASAVPNVPDVPDP